MILLCVVFITAVSAFDTSVRIRSPQNYSVITSEPILISYVVLRNHTYSDAFVCLYENNGSPPLWESGAIAFSRSFVCDDILVFPVGEVSERTINASQISRGTHLFSVAVFDSNPRSDWEYPLVLAQDSVLFDAFEVMDYGDVTLSSNVHKSEPIFFQEHTRRLRVGIFLLDFNIHGCNMRLWNLQACVDDKNGLDVTYVSAAAQGPLLTIDDCYRDVAYAPRISSNVSSLDEELVDFLRGLHVVLIPNTHGDPLTDAFIKHVVAAASSRSYPVLVLDLCNVPVFKAPFNEFWTKSIDGYIAPSEGTAARANVLSKGKYINIVNPPIGNAFHMPVTSCAVHCQRHNCCGCIATVDPRFRLWPRRGPSDRFRVACVGRVSSERSPGLFIHIIKYLLIILDQEGRKSNVDIVVIGDGPLLHMMLPMARDLGIDRDIEFVGHKSQSELFDILSQMDLVVNTALYETFGISNAEAQATGTPVVTWSSMTSKESLSVFGSFLVNPKNELENWNGENKTADAAADYLLRRFAYKINDVLKNWNALDKELLCRAAYDRIESLNIDTHALRMSKMLWRHYIYGQLSHSDKRRFRENEAYARIADFSRGFDLNASSTVQSMLAAANSLLPTTVLAA